MATQTQVIKTAGGNYDTPVGVGGTLNNNTGQVLNSSSLTPSSPIQLPPPPTPTNYSPAIANGNATFAANAPAIAAPAAAPADTNNFDSLFKQYLGSQPAPPSASDIYSTLYKSSGIDQATQAVNDKAAAVKAATSNLNSIQAQLAGLNAEATAAQLNQENRLAPTFAIAGEQGAIDRARAVKALPLQAQALAAQAQVASAQGDQQLAQGILKQAQDHLDTAFQLQVQDAQAQYQYKQKVLDTVYQFATSQEQRRLDQIKTQQANQHDLELENLRNQNDIAKIKLQASLTPHNRNTQVVDVGGKKVLIDANTGQVISTIGGDSTAGTLNLSQAQGHIQSISSILQDKALGGSVGPNPLARIDPISSLTGAKSNFIAGVEQLRGQLTLDALTNAKANGATFGALSEGELKLLQDSGSKLSSWAIKDKNGNVVGYNTSEASFRTELDKVNNYARLDYLLKGGDPSSVGVKQMPDGSYWVLNSDGKTYTKIN